MEDGMYLEGRVQPHRGGEVGGESGLKNSFVKVMFLVRKKDRDDRKEEKKKDLPKLSLPALAPVQVNQRTLTLHRNVAGDFGFNVRRTQFPDFRGRLRAVVFAEPTEVRCGPPRPSDIRTGLLPGDQLVKMNGRSVESLGREELLAIIQNSGDQVELTVRAMPELAELCDRTQRGVRDTGDSLMLPPVSNTYLDENISEDERYWLMHKNGYTMARMIETQSDGKVHVMVAGAEMVVDVTDVDKANPSNMDRVEDLARKMQMSGRSQCLILTGVTGSGKSTQLRNVCHYLCEIADGKISAALGVVEAFGNCATRLSKNATRFAQMFSLSFDAAASLRFASIRTFLLDSSHVVKQANGEANFHVFYYLLEGAEPELVHSLRLDSIIKPFRSPLIREEDKNAALLGWSRLKEALSTLGISAAHARAIFSLLAAIGHLCCAGATQSPAQKAQFVRASSAQHAAALLGVEVDQLALAVFRGKMLSGGQSGPANVMNRFSLSNRGQNGQEALEAFVAHLYSELFYAVVVLLNRGLGATNLATTTSITIVDFPGGNFNAAWSEESQSASGLADLTYNYLNERIAELFYDTSFTEPIELYDREQVEVDIEKPTLCPHQITRLIDQKQQLLNCVDIDLRSEERRGLLHILDEEALFPGATDDSFFERIFVHLGESRLIRRGSRPREFVLGHCLGGSPAAYSVNGWVKAAQPNVSEGSVLTLLRSSRDAAINELFSPFGMTRSESATLNIRRATQAAKLDATGLPTACGFFSNISMQTECIISFARHAGGLQFVHCMQPQPPSEGDIRSAGGEMLLDVPFVRSQLRSLLIIDATRASSRGYPERLSFKDFRRRFQCLVKSGSSLDDVLDDRAAAGRILEDSGVFPHTYRLGLSQVLLRSDVLADLENRREVCLSGLIVSFQRVCRKHLSTRWLARRRTLDTAIRCIQRSGRSDEVYREMETRIRELEAVNNELRVSKSRIEGRVAELEQMLSAECSNTQSLGEALERETEHRLQAQKQLIVMQQRHSDEPRLSSSSSSHLDNSMVLSDAKTAELSKELETLRESEATQRTRAQKAIQRLRDVEGELLDLKARNEILEVRNTRFDEEVKAVKEECAKENEGHEQARRERDTAAMLLQEKVDELQSVKAENAELRQSVAKLHKELEEFGSGSDMQNGEVGQLKRVKRQLEAKCAEQEDELDDLAGRAQMLQQTLTRLEMAAERSRIERNRDLDAKEDEIEELRAQYQRRVNMRRAHNKQGSGISSHLLCHSSLVKAPKKIPRKKREELRAFEEQLASLQDANSSLVKQNRILEGRVREIDSRYNYVESSSHYKRELHKAMALLHDTQAMLAHERENAPSQSLIRQLREQLEDAEAVKLSIVKGKHSLEGELCEIRAQLEAAIAAKKACDARIMVLLKEKNSAMERAEEYNDQLQAALKKYKDALQQNSILSIQLKDQFEQLADMGKDKNNLSEKLSEATSQLEFLKHSSVEKHRLLLAEQRIHDLEMKLDLEITQRNRLDTLLAKANDEVEALNERLLEANRARDNEVEVAKRIRKEAASLQDQLHEMRKREQDLLYKCKMASKETENMEMERVKLDAELKSAQQRISYLRESLQDSLENIEDEEWKDDFETAHSGSPRNASFISGTVADQAENNVH
uniref:Uncharacterized protein n=1 Tax=Parascaris univalens TaxID=6257 RepID=A0A915BBY9_PARUN